MQHWAEDEAARAKLEGRHLVTTTTPKSVAKLAFSLIGDNFAITTPTYSSGLITGQEEETNSRARAAWLSALWRSWRNVGQKDAYFDLVFNQVVRGKSALQVAWIAPKPGEKATQVGAEAFQPPVLFRSLNPKNIGYLHDDVSLVVCYHTYEETIRKLKLRYPEIVDLEVVKRKDVKEKVIFTDYWWKDSQGVVRNCYLIDNREFLRSPKESKLPLIPIVIRVAQEYPLDQVGERVDSFIADLIPEWELENEVESMMLTGLKESFWPARYLRNKNGEPIGDLVVGPGAINEVDPTFEFVNEPQNQRSPDFMNANLIANRIRERVQRTSFADALFGLSEPSTRSSIMVNRLAEAGMSILGAIVKAVGRSMMEANSIALCMLSKYSTDGETIYAFDADNSAMRGYQLTPAQVHSSYENHVLIKAAPNLSDDLQKLSIGIQLIVNKVLSAQTIRETLIPFNVPDDEKQRILREAAEMDPNVIQELIRTEWRNYFGYDLPPAEPDFQMTPPQQPPQGFQPPQGAPGMALPPQMQGQMTPEEMMGDAGADPAMFDLMMGQNIDPRQVVPPQL